MDIDNRAGRKIRNHDFGSLYELVKSNIRSAPVMPFSH